MMDAVFQTKKTDSLTYLECIQETGRETLMSGSIVLWCGESPKELRKIKVYMTVILSSCEHFCVLFRDIDCKFRLGHFNLRNCKIIESGSNKKQFEVQLHISERAGLLFEASSNEETEAWKAAMFPRLSPNSPAVSPNRNLFRRRIGFVSQPVDEQNGRG